MSAGRGENNMRSRIAREGARAGRGPSLPQQWPVSSQAVRYVRSMCRERARANGDDLAVAVFWTNDGFSWVIGLVPASRVSWVASLLGRLSNRRVHVFVGRAKELERTSSFKTIAFLSANIIVLFRGYTRDTSCAETSQYPQISLNHVDTKPVSSSLCSLLTPRDPSISIRLRKTYKNFLYLICLSSFAFHVLLHLGNLFN